MKKIFNWNFLFIVIFLFIGGYLRLNHLNQKSVTFSYDQARDAYIASQITHGDLKIIGPPTSINGFFHGVFYYYLITIPYFFSQGDPISVAIFTSILNLLAIIPLYFLGKVLFNSKVGLISAFLYSISFDIVQYSNWLSNPSPAVFFSVIFYLGLALFIFTPRKNLGIILSAIGYALSFQCQFFLGYFIIPILVSFFILKVKPSIKQTTLFCIVALALISTMILSYFKFGFTFIQGFQNLFSKPNKFDFPTLDFFVNSKLIIGRFVENFYRVIFPSSSTFASIWAIFCLIFTYKQIKTKSPFTPKLIFILIFLLSSIVIIPFGGQSTPYINVGLQIPVILISSFFLLNIFNKYKTIGLLIFAIFVFSSLTTNLKYNPQGQIIFAIQKELTLGHELKVLDYTYQNSQNQPFSINTITCPYWINTLWSYLYSWYGQKKYGYLPSFHGRNQAGQLGSLPDISAEDKYFYLIIEPNNGIPQKLIDDGIAYENSFSKVIDEKNFDGIIVQQRQLTKPLEKITFVK
jgi:4-amino-4-deoxy-L-arabinose transferase-like glycosyltransferase